MAALSRSGDFPEEARAAIFHACRKETGVEVDGPAGGVHYGKPCRAARRGRQSAVAPWSAADSNHLPRTESGRFL